MQWEEFLKVKNKTPAIIEIIMDIVTPVYLSCYIIFTHK